MEEFLAQYGLIIILVLTVVYIATRGKKHRDKIVSDAKDAALDAALKTMKMDKLPEPEKVQNLAKIVSVIKAGNKEKVAQKAIEVLTNEIAALPAKKLPDKVSEEDDIDGLGAALNKAIDSETKREKMKRGLKIAASIGAKIADTIL